MQPHHLGEDQPTHALAHDQNRSPLIDLADLHRVKYTRHDLDKAGVKQWEPRRHHLHIERAAHDVFGKCPPNISARDLVSSSQPLDVRTQFVDEAGDLMAKASREAHELRAACAAVCLDVGAAHPDPLDPYSYFAITWLGNFRVTERKVSRFIKDCNPLRIRVARAH